jgi:hypothetical protein
MERYFDAHLYLANWGTHRIMLRLPRAGLDPATATRYCVGEATSSWATRTHVIVDLHSADDEGVEDWVDPEGRLAAIVPARTELAAGDLRPLYLAWLLVVQGRELDEDELEPPVPAGLGELTGLAAAHGIRLSRSRAGRPAQPAASPAPARPATRDLDHRTWRSRHRGCGSRT